MPSSLLTSGKRQSSGVPLFGELVDLKAAPGLPGGAANLFSRHSSTHFLIRDQNAGKNRNGEMEKRRNEQE